MRLAVRILHPFYVSTSHDVSHQARHLFLRSHSAHLHFIFTFSQRSSLSLFICLAALFSIAFLFSRLRLQRAACALPPPHRRRQQSSRPHPSRARTELGGLWLAMGLCVERPNRRGEALRAKAVLFLTFLPVSLSLCPLAVLCPLALLLPLSSLSPCPLCWLSIIRVLASLSVAGQRSSHRDAAVDATPAPDGQRGGEILHQHPIRALGQAACTLSRRPAPAPANEAVRSWRRPQTRALPESPTSGPPWTTTTAWPPVTMTT